MSLKIDVARGTYIIDSWDDVLSLKVAVVEEHEHRTELYRRLTWHQDRLMRAGKLDDMVWIRDIEDMHGGLISITRQWARTDATKFIPNKGE